MTSQTDEVKFFAHGLPAPKGSYRPVDGRSRDGRPVTRLVPMSRREKEWRTRVAVAFRQAFPGWMPVDKDYACEVSEIFYLVRPKAARDRNWPNRTPDLDKLQRCLHDALTDAGLWQDDSMVCGVQAAKRYVETAGEAGVSVMVRFYPNNLVK